MSRIVETFSNGVAVHQATDEFVDKSNIYCEFPWCPPSSSCFVYLRMPAERLPDGEPNPLEFVACQFGSWDKRVIGRGNAATMANGGKFYYSRFDPRGRRQLIRVDLDTFAQQEIDLPEGVPVRSRIDISPGERYVAYNQTLSWSPQRFAVGLADLHTGKTGIIHEDPYICNTHHQFEPTEGKLLMIQHNRGCRFTADGTRELLVGKEGATIFCLEVPSGNAIRLQVGPPYTPSISGHETWLGTTGEVLLTTNIPEDYDLGKGPIVRVKPGGPAREVCPPWQMNHIGIEPSGRVFCCDTYEPDEIIIGSPDTDRAAVVCPARATYKRAWQLGRYQDSHPHAYISPDLKWVVFNSDRTGVQQVYCAEVPEAMIREVLRK